MIPICAALLLGARGPLRKILYLACSLLLMAGLVATFSRGGFIGLMFVIVFLVWKLAGRNRVVFAVLALIVVIAALTFAPSAYRSRLTTTGDDSAIARTDDLKRSLLIAARHPLLGVGMDNYILYSNTGHATHNSYTQVASEMGLIAFLLYLGFLVSPIRGLSRLEQATGAEKRKPAVYYLAVGVQASIVGYMVVSFFSSVAYVWYAYYLVAYAVCLQRLTPANSTLNQQPSSQR
jgi:O-antigen ligase